MSAEEDHDGGGGHGATWLVSYADMVTLIMAFFVVMYTMSQVDAAKMKKLVESMHSAFAPSLFTKPGFMGGDGNNGGSALVNGGAVEPSQAAAIPQAAGSGGGETASRAEKDLQAVVESVVRTAQQMHLDAQLKSEMTGRGAVISFGETTGSGAISPFESGSAALDPKFIAVLDRLAPALRASANKIEVQGHTDTRPIRSAAFPSNWELSAARAGSVVRYLVQKHGFVARQFVCTGLADTNPLDSGNTPEAWAHNRRIEIVITRQPIDAYDQMTRAEAAEHPQDITQPLGPQPALSPGPVSP